MCGFAGFLTADRDVLDGAQSVAVRMADALQHRGPDAAGVWSERSAGVALSHRRLSIIDLSAAGHQPMPSAGGRFVTAYNGEIYNHVELRAELERAGFAPPWRGHSDTETLLAAFEAWGVSAALEKTVGMFALAVWDCRERTLHLARDRLGEKPLYYGWTGGSFVFGSELKALCRYPGFSNDVSRTALGQYMRFMYVPTPLSIYEDIYKLEPGCLLTVRGIPAPRHSAPPVGATAPDLSLHRWWSFTDAVERGTSGMIANPAEAAEALEHQLQTAVRLQSLADVPLGAFLSGGVDSSTIAALMQSQSSRPIKTFTIGFDEPAYDESPYSRAVAQHLKTDHTELFVRIAEAQAVIPKLPTIYDEPFADSSQIPTFLVCRAARQLVTVALSGDAGDELFGGYNRYFWGPRLWEKLAWLPFPARQGLGHLISGVPGRLWDGLGVPLNAMLPASRGISRPGEKAHKLASRLKQVETVDDLYMSLVSEWQDPAEVVKLPPGAGSELPPRFTQSLPEAAVAQAPLRMMARDSVTYLPDDILCKVDRAAMAVSLETRVPFLDHRVVELAWRLPLDFKIRGGQGKWILRQVLHKYVPRHLIDRPKSGFAIPIGQWLRGPLRAWAENLLDTHRLDSEGFLHTEAIRHRWEEHLSGRRDHTHSLWAVLMFEAWLEQRHSSLRHEAAPEGYVEAL